MDKIQRREQIGSELASLSDWFSINNTKSINNTMNEQHPTESRKDYLYRAAIELLEKNWEAQECKVYYDEATCDGMCLLEEMKAELRRSSMTREQYDKLKDSGMMWEMHPEFTGDYETDI